MSDDPYNDPTIDDTDGNEPDGPPALREAYKAQKAENAELKERLDRIEQAGRDEKINKVVEATGLPPDEAKEMIGDADPDEWYSKFGKYIGGGTTSTDTSGDGSGGDDTTTAGGGTTQAGSGAPAGLTEEQKAALAQTTAVEPGTSRVNTSGRPDFDSLDGATSQDEAYDQLRKMNLLAPNRSQFGKT